MLAPKRPFDLKRHLYLVDLYNQTARRMVIYKAGQMGASEYLISYAFHAADERRATVLYVFPTDKHVSDFSSARIGPAIEASSYLGSIVVEGGERGADRVTLKRIRDRFLYFRGGKVSPEGRAPQLKSVDADVLVLDEWDEMDPRAPAIARKRLGHSLIAEERVTSTPTYPSIGIHTEWLASDRREWYVRCGSCNEWQPLTIQQVVTAWDSLDRPVSWHGQEEERAFVACRECGRELDRLGPGEWVAEYPGREVVGYHLTRLFSHAADIAGIVKTLQSTDETVRKECFNQDLGEPYSPKGGRITDEILDSCRGEYGHAPVEGEQTVMGIDVGKVLHVVIRGPAGSGRRPQRFAGEVDTFDEVGRMMRRFNVRSCVIDALPETRKARELQGGFPRGVVWLAYYVTQKIGTKRAEPIQWDRANGVVNLDRTQTLDQTYSLFYDTENTLPANAKSIRDYYAHLKALVRILEDGPGGQKVARYVETGPDHYAHAENYCTVAALGSTEVRQARSWQG